MVRFLEIQQFPDFLELFAENFRTICPRFENFEKFGSMVSAPCLRTQHFVFVTDFKTILWEVFITNVDILKFFP